MSIKHIFLAALLLCTGSYQSQAQRLRNPFDFPILLSGNFGELRSNHFHSGIDFKTQGVEGKPVHAVQEGYVSRISVSPWGYGNGLYITHPDGTTTVYGHLQRFSKKNCRLCKRATICTRELQRKPYSAAGYPACRKRRSCSPQR